jgi:hypothetical protein
MKFKNLNKIDKKPEKTLNMKVILFKNSIVPDLKQVTELVLFEFDEEIDFNKCENLELLVIQHYPFEMDLSKCKKLKTFRCGFYEKNLNLIGLNKLKTIKMTGYSKHINIIKCRTMQHMKLSKCDLSYKIRCCPFFKIDDHEIYS